MQYIKVFLSHNLLAVNFALEKYLFEDADMASHAKIFSSHLCKQSQLLICSFPLSKHFVC